MHPAGSHNQAEIGANPSKGSVKMEAAAIAARRTAEEGAIVAVTRIPESTSSE